MQRTNDRRQAVGSMNRSKYELTPSTTCTDDDLSGTSPLVAFGNLRVVQTNIGADRRRSSTSRSAAESTVASWNDSYEDFTDGEDFLTGSPAHSNPFREEVDSVGSVRRVRSISLNDPTTMRPVPSALSLPQIALEPRSDSPDCDEMERRHRGRSSDGQRRKQKTDRSRSARRQRHQNDNSGEKHERKSKKKSRKKHGERHRKSSITSEANTIKDDAATSTKRDESRMKRRSRTNTVPQSDSLQQAHDKNKMNLKKEMDTTTRRPSRRKDLTIDLEKNVEKAVSHRVLASEPASAKPKMPSSKSRHKKKSSHRRRQSKSTSITRGDESSTTSSSVATSEARQRVQEAHVLAMDMLRKAQSQTEYDVDRPPFYIDIEK